VAYGLCRLYCILTSNRASIGRKKGGGERTNQFLCHVNELSCLWVVMSMSCYVYELLLSMSCHIYELLWCELLCLWVVVSMNCHVFELSCLWVVMFLSCHVFELSCLWVVMSLSCHVFELSCLWIVMSMKKFLWVVCLWVVMSMSMCSINAIKKILTQRMRSWTRT